MTKISLRSAWLLPLMLAVIPVATAQTPPPAADETLHYLNAADFAPQQSYAAPPARHSAMEALEMARIEALISAAKPERIDQALWDAHHPDPSAFNAVMGVDLEKLPATWALLTEVQREADLIAEQAKVHFARLRPSQIDIRLTTCGKPGAGKAPRSYPSGHAVMGYAVGWVLSRLAPQMAPAILTRADDYALSRELCAAHFHSDTEAGHVIGTLVADRLLADPRLAAKIAAARAELTAALPQH